MTEKTPLQELMATARQLVAETRTAIGRDEVIDEVTRAIDEIVEVVLVQHDLIEGLMRRVGELERRLGLWVAIGAIVLVLGFVAAFKLI